MQVATIMTTRVVTVEMDDRLSLIRDIFNQARFRHLMVMEEGELLGIISDRDLLRALSPYLDSAAEQARDTETLNRRAHQIMTRQPIMVSPHQTLAYAARLMLDKKVSCLPVLDRGTLVGVLSWKDLLKAAVEEGAL
ncbi:CBS domain-containing protein [Aeromonas bivalvium]|uniref:CBS domain-containing protein n=1 Tax=Aeromonas bivalvium TaxID=440079 RepID=UPI0005AA7DC1|nr:CBS domain-containing protein [Aeromonas bivalvium]